MSAAVVVIAALVLWAVTRGGGGGDGKGTSAPAGSHTPVGTITAGPTPSGTHISGRPGGRDTAPSDTDGGNSGGDTAGSGATPGDTAGSGDDGTDAGASSAGTDPGSGTTGGNGGGSSGGTAVPVPAGSSLPNCTSGTVALSLTTDQNQYPVGQYPVFTLRATNSGAADCKLDVSAVSAVLDVTKDPDNTHVWSSDDCPPSKSPSLVKIPAHSSAAITVRWNGKTSSPACKSPKGTPATPGNYLAQITVPGFGVKQRSFSLSAN
ncbi:hypothetical protein [Streptomyces sp. NPDC021020]|uniref:hypothetical protein n=1 Tax=Streptomyces sp. NPDC021020 TaxID=3365109 RepID=UPI00378C176E